MRKLIVALEAIAVITVIALLLSGLHANASGQAAAPSGISKAAAGAKPDQKKSEKKTDQRATSTTKKATTNSAKKQSKTSAKQPSHKRYSARTGPNKTRRVALTYDDCPRSLKAFKKVMVGAEKLGIGLMLFPTGVCVRSGGFSAAFARSHGHYVFNHSISHPNFDRLSRAGLLHQLSKPGIQSRYGRPPYGAWNPGVARAYAAKGMKIWTWTVDTEDWRGRSQQSVISSAVHSPRAGGTVLMHMQWHGFSVTALRQMKAGLDKRGLGVCRNFPGTTPVRSWTVRC